MGQHYNPSISERYVRIFNPKFDYNADIIADVIQPVVQINPISNIVRSNSSTTTGSTTVYTTPSDKDFYLTSLQYCYMKDAANDATSIGVNTTIQGVLQNLVFIRTITTTASQDVVNISFPYPIKIDRGVAVSIYGTFTAGNLYRSLVITGYTEEVTK